MARLTQTSALVRLGTPDLTEELVRFLRHLGYGAREVDYGVVAVEADALDPAHLGAHLRIWQRVHARGTAELDAA